MHIRSSAAVSAAVLLASLAALQIARAQAGSPASLLALDTPYTQNFNTLASTGTSSVLPAGWEFVESGTNANTTYTAGTGSSNAGDTYSFGAAASAERALGGLQSGTLIPLVGGFFSNDTGSTITSLEIAYTGEQWRLGALGRVDRLDFQYSLNATSLSAGTWVDADALDFVAPTTAGAVGALDGQAAANRRASAASSPASASRLARGSRIRWVDFNAIGRRRRPRRRRLHVHPARRRRGDPVGQRRVGHRRQQRHDDRQLHRHRVDRRARRRHV